MKKISMPIDVFGWKSYSKNFPELPSPNTDKLARVTIENKSVYTLQANIGQLEGFLSGKSLYRNESSADSPKVGDWVEIEKLPNEKRAVIQKILPRKSKLSRKEKMESVNEQVLVTNIDLVFIVQGLDDDFSLRRLERYQAIVREGGSDSIILLNKKDLVTDLDSYLEKVKKTFPETKILAISAENEDGINEVQENISPFKTVVFTGSSGAGKSTIINKLLSNEIQKTKSVRKDDSRGRHTTTRRELFILPNGGIVIDIPGMREIGVNISDSLETSFLDIKLLMKGCKFNKCDHNKTEGCAVIKAIESGKLDEKRYLNFLKLETELLKNARRKNILQSKERKYKKRAISKNIRKLKKHKPNYSDFNLQ